METIIAAAVSGAAGIICSVLAAVSSIVAGLPEVGE